MLPTEDRADDPPEPTRERLSWNVLAGAPKWWFRAEVPPTLGPAGTRERVIRTSVLMGLMGLMGLAASWLSTVLILGLSSDHSLAPMGHIVLLFVNPGTVYALFVILPWSIWMRLPIRWAILTIFYCASFTVAIGLVVIVAPDPQHPPAVIAAVVWPTGILCWCIWRSASQPQFLILPGVMTTVVAWFLVQVVMDDSWTRLAPPAAYWAIQAVRYAANLSAFSIPVAITLGSSLWKLDRQLA